MAYRSREEAEFQDKVVAFCQWLHLLVYHVGRSDKALVTSKGFPDLVISGPFGTVFAELKSETGKPSVEQTVWMASLSRSCEHVYLWRPSDWPQIEAVLRKVAGR